MKPKPRFDPIPLFFTALAAFFFLTDSAGAQEARAEAESRTPQQLSPMQQVTSFYATCKNGEGGTGLREMLSANPVVNPEDVDRVAKAFEEMLGQMGGFLDFNILRTKQISDRTVIYRCVAHFERQPFLNEFTFYDAGNGWLLVHLRYDANLATMFAEEMREPEKE